MNSRLLILLLLILSAAAIWGAFAFDDSSREAVREAQGPEWKKSTSRTFHSLVRRYGDWPWLMLAGGIGLGAARVFRSRKWQRILIAAMLASTVAGLTINISRLTTGRTRPGADKKIEQGFHGPWADGQLTIGKHAYNSFPSGHTATAFGFAGVILFASPGVGLVAMAIAGLIAFSSVMVDAHHLSDVTVSTLIALTVAWLTWRWVEKSGDEVWAKFLKKLQSLRG